VIKLISSVIAASFLIAGQAFAGDPLGLKEAVALALEKNHLIQAATYERAAAEAGVASSRSRYLPRITFEERAGVTDSGTRAFMMKLDEGRFSLAGDLNHPSTTGDFQTTLMLEQPLFDLNVGREVEVVREEAAFRSHAVEQRRQDVAFQVYAAYLNVHRAQSQLAVAEQAERDAREQMRVAKLRTASGLGLRYDELRIGTFLAELEQQKITAENEVRIAHLRLGQVIGLPAGAAPDIRGRITSLELNTSDSELEKESLLNRSDLRALTAQVAKGEAGVAAARGGYWPTVYASASYQMNDRDIPLGRDNDSWMLAATLRWEVFDGMRRRSEVERVQANRNAASAYLNNQRQEVALQVREGLLRRNEAVKRLEVARDSVKDAEEMLRLINKRFENGLATTVELLDAQTALNRSRAQLTDNETTFALSTARVYQSAGLFLREVLK